MTAKRPVPFLGRGMLIIACMALLGFLNGVPSFGQSNSPTQPSATPWQQPPQSPPNSFNPNTGMPTQSSTSIGYILNQPNPNMQPTTEQTRWYVENHPDLRNLDPGFKSAIIYSGAGSGLLNSYYLPNGAQNPFYNASTGQSVPNWYLRSTWPATGTNWQGVQPSGFLPSASATTHSSSFSPSVYNPTPSSNNYTERYTQPYYQRPPPPPSPPIRNTLPSQTGLNPFPTGSSLNVATPRSAPSFNAAAFAKLTHDHETALSVSQTAGDKIGVLIHATALAQLFVAQGNPKEALKHLAAAEPFVKTASDPRAGVDYLRTAFTAHMQAGEFENALADNTKVLPILVSLKDDAGRAETYLSSAWASQSIGDIPHAISSYEAAASLFSAPSIHNDDGLARARIGLGSLYQSLGEHVKAIEQYNAALPHASKPQVARILDSYAEILQARGPGTASMRYWNLPSRLGAIVAYKKALPLAHEEGDATLEVAVLTGLGRAYMSMSNFPEAEQQFAAARALVEKSPNPGAKAGVIASQGELNYWMAISGTSPHGSPRAHFKKALENYSSALPLMRSVGDRYGEIGVLTNSGLVFDAEGRTKEALNYYLQALQKMDDLQTLARLQEFRSSLADQSSGLYGRAIELSVHSHQFDKAFELSERARARMFLDQLGNARVDDTKQAPPEFFTAEKELRHENILLERQLGQELAKPGPELNVERIEQLRAQGAAVRTSYAELLGKLKLSNPAYASFLSVSPATIAEAQERLDATTTIVSYYTGPDSTFAFIVTKSGLKAKKLNANSVYLSHEVSSFRDFASDEGVSPSLRLLYKALIAPIRSELKTSNLVIVPHGVLHELPFAALTSDGRRFLGDDYLISYSPSVSALSYLRPSRNPAPLRALVLANDQNEGLPRLSSAEDEALSVAAILGAKPLLGQQATPAALREQAPNLDILHLVSHFEVDRRNPMASKILLGHTGNNDDGSLDLAGIYALSLHNTGLVVLSGCQSQTGRRTRGDDIASLSRAFLYAGSSSVIASLWSVDDDATRQLMVAFYTHLKEGLNKAESLRAAQMDVRQKYPNPFYWAGFVLTGDPGL
jgi:CHAT domain-containing protein